MKPTPNEEIGMSKQGIDYVNSLEVKEEIYIPETPTRNTNITEQDIEVWRKNFIKSVSNNIPEEMEQQRIKREGRNALICVLIIIAITFITNYFNK